MQLKIKKSILKEFIGHAKENFPIEACGLLAGTKDYIQTLYIMTNTDKSHEHYTLDPKEQFWAIKHARKNNEVIMGCIHSHPHTPARPSQEDKKLALQPDFVHLIVSLATSPEQTKAFDLTGEVEKKLDMVEVEDDNTFYSQVVFPESFENIRKSYRENVLNSLTCEDEIRFKAKRVPLGVYQQRTKSSYMVRIRVPGGLLTPEQLEKTAKIAKDYGSQILHITTRQSLQIHDVQLKDTPDILDSLACSNLSTVGSGGNTIRGITTCPFAGACENEIFDITAHANYLTEKLLKKQWALKLPRKFKIAFSGCKKDCANSLVSDLGFVATQKDKKKGFEVYAGGGMGKSPQKGILLDSFLEENNLLNSGQTVINIFLKESSIEEKNNKRFRHLVSRIGHETVLSLYSSEFKENTKQSDNQKIKNKYIFNLSGNKNIISNTFVNKEKVPGLFRIDFYPRLGNLTSNQALILSNAASKGLFEIKLTTTQGVSLCHIPGEKVKQIEEIIAEHFGDLKNSLLTKPFISCAGASTCKLGLCDSRALTDAIFDALKKEKLTFPENWPTCRISGCANSCAGHQAAEFGIQGFAKRIDGRLLPMAKIWTRDNNDNNSVLSKQIGSIPIKAVSQFMTSIVSKAHKENTANDAFFQLIEKNIKEFKTIASFEEQPDFYKDYGTDKPFSLANRTAGECGIGVLDVIDADFKAASANIEEFKKTNIIEKLNQAGLYAARALLITRGIDDHEPAKILNSFEVHFIKTNLVSSDVADTIEYLKDVYIKAENGNPQYINAITQLFKLVKELYNNMDSSFNFANEKPETNNNSSSDKKETVPLDLRGVACPINFVRAKIALDPLPSGSRLEILLDDGPPIKNVPASFVAHGQKIISIDHSPKEYNVLIVEKES